MEQESTAAPTAASSKHGHLRFHLPHAHLAATFGNDWFGLKAESFARFFGTPTFLIGQTVIVGVWIVANLLGWSKFDAYPFILLNLAFSLQAAYAAPLILLAQTRQAERDKTTSDADAQHREDLARISAERQATAAEQTAHLLELMRRNTELTELTKALSERIETLTEEVHRHILATESPQR
ncbi:DUF1003 domain-containing protein [Luteolibacter sp. LG18]|uniref:DUF1003 domain-containing protein n=1 Tax=Luteolibacter sp. LG18 TaxID=2819286 RepID=UPI002B2962D2|nr:hypothetical protein llg_13030 [Luteolibacter sp. LG18]